MDANTRHLQHLLQQVQQLPEVLLLKPITGSTNDDVKEIASKGISSILVCSEQQTQGRGQHQRSWVSPEGNIYLSTLLHTTTPIDGRFALEIALNILQMPSLKGLNLQVEWPNDLYSPQGKWGGILIEPLNLHHVVVGVGLNLFPVNVELDQAATSLQQLGLAQPDRIQLIAELYLALHRAAQWFNHGCVNLTERFNHHAAFLNQMVDFEYLEHTLTGTFQGIDADGAVILQHTQEVKHYYQGRLKLRTTTV